MWTHGVPGTVPLPDSPSPSFLLSLLELCDTKVYEPQIQAPTGPPQSILLKICTSIDALQAWSSESGFLPLLLADSR